MPGLGAEAMIFLYAGLSGLTVLAGYDVYPCLCDSHKFEW